MKRVISFDLDGTLTTRKFADAVWEEGIPFRVSLNYKIPKEMARFLCRNAYEIIGDRSVRYYQLPYWLKHFGLKDDAHEIIKSFSGNIALYDDVIPTLRELKREGFKLIIFSNATRLFLDEEMDRSGLNSYFDLIVSLPDDWNMLKSDPRAFRRLENAAGHFIHVGDNIHHDFESPAKAGYTAFHVFRGEGYRHECSIDSLDELINIVNE